MRKLELNLKSSSFFTVLCCLLIGLFLSTASIAQKVSGKPTPPPPTSPADCNTGCTSNDVRIDSAYLVNPVTLQKLDGSFICEGNAQVKLALILSTNTPRVGVVIYANIKNFTGGTPGAILATPSECFGDSLNKPSNKVVFQTTFGWPCGTPIVLTDVFIGWGTGNTNFCTGSVFQCPATSSKCFSLPPGQYITIQIPIASTASATECETTPGGGTASFNLTALNGTVTNNASGVTVNYWENFTSSVLSNCIPTPGAYTSGSKTVYAKVKNNSDTAAFAVSPVTLTVNPKATASAGGPYTMCSTDASVNLTGTYGGGATGGTWSGGAGTFGTQTNNAGPKTITTAYTPAVGEKTAGSVQLTFTASDPDGTGPCLSIPVNVTVTINATSTASAGGPYTMCSSSTSVNLTGTYGGGATGGTWSSGAGSFGTQTNNAGPKTITTAYTPTTDEKTAGSVQLTFTAADPDAAGPCSSVPVNVTVTINAGSTASAGGPYTMCSSGTSVNLTGTYGGGATGGTWSGGAGSFGTQTNNAGPKTITTSYTPTAGEKTAGSVQLTFTAADPDAAGPCSSVPVNVTVAINAVATANAGGPYTMCSSDASVNLTGTYGGGATGGTWSGGAGSFGTQTNNAGPKTITTAYTPTTGEKTAGSVQLTFTATDPDGAGPCSSVPVNVTVTVNTAPIAPTVTYIYPTCLETTFKVSVDNPHDGSTYTLRQLSGGVSPMTKSAPTDVVSGKIIFAGLTVGKGYRVTETTGSGCISLPEACGDFSSVVGAVMSPQTIVSEESQTTVKAYPNPFSDKINFVITSSVAGKGNLDVYNMMGQKVKTVYTGFIAAGTQTFELRLPTQQVSNLIYVLRVGGKKMSGKILQINN